MVWGGSNTPDLIFHEKNTNSIDMNSGLLSDMICSGRPYVAKIHRNTEIVLSEVVELTSYT